MIISSLPREWVLRNIEGAVGDILARTDTGDCRRVLELYAELDQKLLEKACNRLTASGSGELQALADDFSRS